MRLRAGGLFGRIVVVAAIGAGLLAVVLAALPEKLFDLDRYFVPKELVLHCVALMCLASLLSRGRQLAVDGSDVLVALFVAWSGASAMLATNHWLAQRALGVTVSGAVIFWAARQLGAHGWHRALLVAAAAATVCAAATALAQAYGLSTEYFSLNRAPGGTFGNRNFVAHFCVIGLPALAFVTVTSRWGGALFGSAGAVIVGAALVLTRSRGAWLALGLAAVVVAIALAASRPYWRRLDAGRQVRRFLIATAAGAALAVALPNHLNWISESPYLDSAVGMLDYRTGSGRGRLEQYRNSVRMALASPVFGVGPGNWPVRYGRFAKRSDPSLASDGMTANPWPSSDWVAVASERGIPGVILLFGVLAALFVRALRGWSALSRPEHVLARVTLAATITATVVVSAFDAVLLLAPPSLLAWTVIGAASGVGLAAANVTKRRGVRLAGIAAIAIILIAAVTRSATQIIAIHTVGRSGSLSGWTSAARWDPGSYRINLRAAEVAAGRRQCASARAYAARAAAQFPDAAAPRRVIQACN
jgi:O-antigen ligase